MNSLFNTPNIKKKRYSMEKMEEVFSEIQRLSVVRYSLFSHFYFHDVTEREKYKQRNNDKYGHIRELLKDKSLYEVCELIINRDIYCDLPEIYFSGSALMSKMIIDKALKEVIPSQKEEIKLLLKQKIKDDEYYINKDWDNHYKS